MTLSKHPKKTPASTGFDSGKDRPKHKPIRETKPKTLIELATKMGPPLDTDWDFSDSLVEPKEYF
jgi:hypothetical protein